MNNTLNEYIKYLSKKDKKNLIEKNLKLLEETGELAKLILPYGNAHSTTHRFTNKHKILEEIADSILCLISMIHDETIDLTIEDLEEMMYEKSKYWNELQAREENITYPLPYEIHVTIEATEDIQKFKDVCKELNVKPIVLDLNVMTDYMTSSVFRGNNGEAIREVERISKSLIASGFNVVREKVETVPWHPSAPSIKHLNPVMPKDCYFECHFAVKVEQGKDKDLDVVVDMIPNMLHKSRNIFKKNEDGSHIQMLTHRKYDGTYEEFNKSVDYLKSILEDCFTLEKTIVEFSIYDSRVSHDKKWIGEHGDD